MSKTIELRYFARIREALNVEQESFMTDADSVEQILAELRQRGEPWNSVLSSSQLLIAVNQEMTSASATVNAGDEVAFFPPVTGG